VRDLQKELDDNKENNKMLFEAFMKPGGNGADAVNPRRGSVVSVAGKNMNDSRRPSSLSNEALQSI